MSDFVKNADENIMNFKDRLRFPANFDMLDREVRIGGKKAGFFFIDGFVQEDMVEKLMQFFYSLKPEDVSNIDKFLENGIIRIISTDISKRTRGINIYGNT